RSRGQPSSVGGSFACRGATRGTAGARRSSRRPRGMTPPRTATSPRRPVPAPERPRHLRVVRGRPAPGRRPPTVSIVPALTATGMALFALVVAQVFLGQAAFRQSSLENAVQAKRLTTEQIGRASWRERG